MRKHEFELIYSRQHSDFMRGKAYSNPKFFSTPREGVTKVYVVGDWPDVVNAYKARNVPVVILNEDFSPMPDAPAKALEPIEPAPGDATHPDVEIPAGWNDLPWIGADSVRALAVKLANGVPVLNKAQAVAVITAELARRG